MVSRRSLLSTGGSILIGGGIMGMLSRTGAAAAEGSFSVVKSDDEWRKILSPQAYEVLRKHGTERAGSSPLDHEKRQGIFACAGCAQDLFSSRDKFDSGTGWPSFTRPIDNAVGTSEDRTYFMVRTEVHCSRCGGHLGHVFNDGPKPTGLRYCMNGVAMTFRAADQPA